MNNLLKRLTISSLLVVAQAMAVNAFAAQGIKAPEGYVGDRTGTVVTDRVGDCVKTGFPPPAGTKCAEKVAATPTPEPTPTPVPEAKTETFTLGATTLFDFNKSNLHASGKEKLDDLVAKIKAHQSVDSITVTGHTDSVGTNAYNQKLSERRAHTVRDYLVKSGIDAKLITARGMGETKPVATNATAAGRQQNRRVEVEVVSRN
ncbi:MAG: OmpA family protein [Gammaproteobacteria bacterium]